MTIKSTALAEIVADGFGIGTADLRGPSTASHCVVPRHFAFALHRVLLAHSLTRIGQFYNRDHTTVLYGINRHGDRLAADADFRVTCDAVRESIMAEITPPMFIHGGVMFKSVRAHRQGAQA